MNHSRYARAKRAPEGGGRPPRRRSAWLPIWLAAAIALTSLLAACGEPAHVEHAPVGARVAPLAATVPFAYSPGREVSVVVERTGGYTGPVAVDINAASLPSGVTLSATALSFAAGESEKVITLVADAAVAAADLDLPVALTLTTTAGGLTTTSALSVQVSGLVMTTADAGEGSLRHVEGLLPSSSAASFIVVSFDPVAFAAPATIELASSLDLQSGRHISGPTDETGAPLVTLRAAPGATGLIGIKDGVDAKLSNLVLAGVRGGTNGGAIHNLGALQVVNLLITDNEASYGAAIYNNLFGELSVVNSRFAENHATGVGAGGAIYNNGGKVTIEGSAFQANSSATSGGALANSSTAFAGTAYTGDVYVRATEFTSNTARAGGAIHNAVDSSLTVVESAFSSNATPSGASLTGGAIVNNGTALVGESEFNLNTAGAGGAIYLSNTGALRIYASTFAHNSATSNGGALFVNGVLDVTNSTFWGNRSQRGGAIIISSHEVASARIAFSTISGNSATTMPGASGQVHGGGIAYSRPLELRGSIVAGNTVAAGAAGGPDLYQSGATATFDSGGYNLIGDPADSGVFGPNNLLNQDPLLGPLQDNGGPTRTLALLPGSPAKDQAPQSQCLDATSAPLVTDQRGATRPSGTHCDVGAFEVQ